MVRKNSISLSFLSWSSILPTVGCKIYSAEFREFATDNKSV